MATTTYNLFTGTNVFIYPDDELFGIPFSYPAVINFGQGSFLADVIAFTGNAGLDTGGVIYYEFVIYGTDDAYGSPDEFTHVIGYLKAGEDSITITTPDNWFGEIIILDDDGYYGYSGQFGLFGDLFTVGYQTNQITITQIDLIVVTSDTSSCCRLIKTTGRMEVTIPDPPGSPPVKVVPPPEIPNGRIPQPGGGGGSGGLGGKPLEWTADPVPQPIPSGSSLGGVADDCNVCIIYWPPNVQGVSIPAGCCRVIIARG